MSRMTGVKLWIDTMAGTCPRSIIRSISAPTVV